MQKTRDDTPLSARVTAEEAFKPVAPAPAHGQPVVDPITGQPMAPQGYYSAGAPIMGL